MKAQKNPPERVGGAARGHGRVDNIKNSLSNRPQTWAANSVLTATLSAPEEPWGRNQIVCMTSP